MALSSCAWRTPCTKPQCSNCLKGVDTYLPTNDRLYSIYGMDDYIATCASYVCIWTFMKRISKSHSEEVRVFMCHGCDLRAVCFAVWNRPMPNARCWSSLVTRPSSCRSSSSNGRIWSSVRPARIPSFTREWRKYTGMHPIWSKNIHTCLFA